MKQRTKAIFDGIRKLPFHVVLCLAGFAYFVTSIAAVGIVVLLEETF